jgi:hypothetical protein
MCVCVCGCVCVIVCWFILSGIRFVNHNWKVFVDDVIVFENDDQIHFELDLELFGNDSRASEQPREDHVYWDVPSSTHIAINQYTWSSRGCSLARLSLPKSSRSSSKWIWSSFSKTITSSTKTFQLWFTNRIPDKMNQQTITHTQPHTHTHIHTHTHTHTQTQCVWVSVLVWFGVICQSKVVGLYVIVEIFL